LPTHSNSPRPIPGCAWCDLAARSRLQTKHAINQATLSEFDATLARETVGQHVLLNAADLREGIKAFQDKRAPVFTDT
jgi:enoyl-CoA hydratase/carnithine racemase